VQRVLLLDVVAADVIGELSARGIRSLLMKGPSVANWLYDDGELRAYVDVDLLVDPGQLAAAGSVLTECGFEPGVGWNLDQHAENWVRRRDGAGVDLHWRILGIGSDPRRAWESLSSTAEQLRVARTEVEALGIPARALHLALHAARNGREQEQSMRDLMRGLARLDEDTWRAAAALADELDAAEPMAVGLRLVPEGRVLADRLGLPSEVSARWALSARTPPPWSQRLYEIGAAPGVRAKARALTAGLVPPASYVRERYRWARTGRWALVLAYAVRLISGLRHLPAAIRALRRARAEARRSRQRPG
jgi:hypothetical protein